MIRFLQSALWCGIAVLVLCAIAAAQATRPAHAGSALQQHYDAAQQLQKAGKSDEAAREYRAFLAAAQQELAEGYSVAKNYARAASLFEQAVTLDPDSVPLRMDDARAALLAGDPSRAAVLAQSVLSAAPAEERVLAETHQILGRALLKQNQDREARAELEKAVELDPSFANSYDLAVVCLDLDDGTCASQIFDKLEQSYGDTPALHMQFGLAYGNSDFVPRAIAEFSKVIAENPRYPGAHYCLAAALLSSGDDAKNVPAAETELKKELEISPHDALTYAALGKLAVADHRNAAAEKYLKAAASLDPRNPDTFLYLGQLYFDTNRVAEAEAALRKSIELTTDPSRNRFQIQKTHFLLGRALMQEHRPAEAHAEMDLARSFANKDLSHDKGELAGLLNNSAATGATDTTNGPAAAPAASPQNRDTAPESLRAHEKRLAPAIADSYNNLGVIAATGGQYAEALTYFNRAAEWDPALDGLDLNRGRAAFMASKFSDAIPPLLRYVNAHPRDSGVRGALAMSQFMTRDYNGCVRTLSGIEDQLVSIPQMAYVFADSLVQIGRTAEGKRRLEELESEHPEIPDVHRALGEVLATDHDRSKAAAELHTALVLNSSDAQAHYDLGKLSVESGDAAAAIPELQAAIQIAPNELLFHRELAIAYRLASRNEDAQKETAVSDRLAIAAQADQPGERHESSH
jgi:tetratricopeptide (TPR) repeat protein